MLRRRQKAARVQRHATPGPAPGPRARRRPRPDLPVPPELRLREPAPPAAGRGPRAPGAPPAGGVVLVTGFDPFGGERMNPSWEVCSRLPGEIAGLRVETCRVPCAFDEATATVTAAIERHRPAMVLCLGLAGGRAQLSVERVAINVDDARMADNAGAAPVDEPIARDGPPAYFATLPVKAMVAAMRAAGAPAQVSNTAGTYVCNHVMYGVLHFLAGRGEAARAGFVHLPYAEEQVIDRPGAPAMALATMARGIEAAIAAAARTAQDLRIPEGTTD